MLEAYDPAARSAREFLGRAEMAVFVETFGRTGFTGGINWYRNFTRNWIHVGGDRRQVKSRR